MRLRHTLLRMQRLLLWYAGPASCLVIIHRYLGRFSHVDSFELVQYQLWTATLGVAFLKVVGVDRSPWTLEHGFNEAVSWGFIATGFAIQLIAGMRTLTQPNITEWYLL